MKNFKFKISKFNQYLILLISILFLYLFYLSIPSLYDKGRVQKHLSDYILKEFNIDFSLSSQIRYSILPSPHIVIENVKIFNNFSSDLNEVSQIKKLKVFISQKTLFESLFDEKKIKINRILIEKANFIIKNNNLNYYNNFLDKKLSENEIKVIDSNFFYKDDNNETISILYFSEINLQHLKGKLENNVIAHGEVFKLPFTLKLIKKFDSNKAKISNLKIKKLALEIDNISEAKEEKTFGDNTVYINNIKLKSKYELDKDKISFFSKESKSKNEVYTYNGNVSLSPFILELNINLPKLSKKEIFNFIIFFNEILKTNLLFNPSISASVKVDTNKIISGVIFDKFKIFLNLNNGKVDIDNSILTSSKIGNLRTDYSSIYLKKNNLIFSGSFNFRVNNQSNFYKIFQISKKNRKPIKNIFFDIDMNFFNNSLIVKNIRIDEGDIISNDIFDNFLNEMNSVDLSNKNWIYIKRFTSKLIELYDG